MFVTAAFAQEHAAGTAGEVAAEVAVAADEHGYQFPPFDSTTFASQLFWLAITFFVLYFVIARVAVPRIATILADRRGRIAADIETAERMKAESEAAGAAYEKSLAEARAGAGVIAEQARAEARAAAEAERGKVEGQLNRKLAAAEAEIAAIKARAVSEVGTIARDAASAIVKALVDAEPAAREVDEAVAKSLSG
jgi:F-type H+-transporting ATPase subunit b